MLSDKKIVFPVKLNENRVRSVFIDLLVATILLGLLMTFTKLVKFIVLFIQEFNAIREQFSNEKETIDRTSRYIVNTVNGKKWESNFELSNTAESLSGQIQNNQFLFLVIIFIAFLIFIALYFAIDFLIDYTNKFKPWSIFLLLITFISSVFYLEITDLKETGNGICFMFTTMISIVSGLILIGYTLIFPNYRQVED
jgi:NADH:ubiquinone oxidoreductase subunit 3 (subunit A)